MAVRYYNTMPDQATQDAIRRMGDTIQIVSGAAPTASAGTGYVAPRQESTFMGDPALTTNDPNAARDPAFGTAQVASAREWIADTAYRNAEQQFQQDIANYNRNLQENPRAFQPGGSMYGVPPPTFQTYVDRQRSQIEGGATMDFTGSADRYGVPSYTPPPATSQTNVINAQGQFNPGVQQPATTQTTQQQQANTSSSGYGGAGRSGSVGDRLASFGGGTDWRTDPNVTSTPTANRYLLPNSPRVTATSGPSTPSPNTTSLTPTSSGYGGSRFALPTSRPPATTQNPTVQTPTTSWMTPQGISTTNLGSTDPRTGNVYTPETPGGNGEGGTTVTGGIGGGGSAANDILGRVMSLLQQNGYPNGAGYDVVAHYYSQITGFPAPSPEALGITNRDTPITAGQFFATMSNAGYNPATGQQTQTPGGPPAGGGGTGTGPGAGGGTGGGGTGGGPGTGSGGGGTDGGGTGGGPGTGSGGGPGTGGGGGTDGTGGPGTGGGGSGGTGGGGGGGNTGGGGSGGTGGGTGGGIPGNPNPNPSTGGYQGPTVVPSGTGSGNPPSIGGWSPYLGSAIDQMAQNDRNMAIGRGNALDTTLAEFSSGYQSDYGDWTSNLMDSYGDIGGYNQDERDLILPGERLDPYQWTDDMTDEGQLSREEYNNISRIGTDSVPVGNAPGRVSASDLSQVMAQLQAEGTTNPNYDDLGAVYTRITGRQLPPPEDLGIERLEDGSTPRLDANAVNALWGQIGNYQQEQYAASVPAGTEPSVFGRIREGTAGIEESVDDSAAAGAGALTGQDTAIRRYMTDARLRQASTVPTAITNNITDTNANIRSATGNAALQTRSGLASDLTGITTGARNRTTTALTAPGMTYDQGVRGSVLSGLGDTEARVRSAVNPADLNTTAAWGQGLQGMADQGAAAATSAFSRYRPTVDPNLTGNINQGLTDSAGRIRQATASGPLTQGAGFAGQVESTLSGNESDLRGTVDPNALRLSNEFTSGYNWTPEDTQALASSAGTTVGMRTQADADETYRRAQAQGNTSPLALAAATSRNRAAGDISAAAAIRDARIAGRQNELATTQTREQMRLQAEQGLSDRQREIETTLGGQRLSSRFATEDQRIQAEQGRAQLQAQAESEIAARGLQGTLQAEELRANAERAAAQLETQIIQQNTNTRLAAAETGERLRTDTAARTAGLVSQNEQALGERRTNSLQAMEAERLRGAQNQGQLISGAEQNFAGLESENALTAEGQRTTAAARAAQLRADSEAGIADRGTQAALSTEQQRMAGEQSQANTGIAAESYLGGARLSENARTGALRTAARQEQSNRTVAAQEEWNRFAADQARFLATNRQTATQRGQDQAYQRGMGIYQAGAQAGQTVGNARLDQQNRYRQSLENLATNASQNATVANQQRVSTLGTQAGAQSAATGNAIKNYGIPGTAEKIGGMILGALADGDVRGTPGPAIVGEAGPELVVNIPKVASYGIGGLIGGAVSGYRGARNYNDSITAPPAGGTMIQDTETGEMVPYGGDSPAAQPKNPYWEALKEATYNPTGQQQETGPDPSASSGSGNARGLLSGITMGRAIGKKGGISSFFLPGTADGGVFSEDGAVAQPLAPGVDYVDGAQVRRLGENGPDAVVPLTNRPTAKVRPGDIPSMVDRYRSGQPLTPMADGGIVGSGTQWAQGEITRKRKMPCYGDGGIIDNIGDFIFGRKVLKKAAGEDEPKSPAPVDSPAPDVMKESIRRQMESQKKKPMARPQRERGPRYAAAGR